jgi:DNA-binding CsgD family transcriptional regulator
MKMLHGRDRELAAIDELMEGARSGRSGALVITGEPGIGKTALLDEAERRSGDLLVLRASGYESERELPFAGLHTLLSPILDLRDRIPPVQARALGTALAIERPAPHDPFAVPAAVLSVLGAAAEDRKILAIVDDLQWLDPGSLRAILFAARRVGAEGIAFVLAARLDEAVLPALTGLPQIELGKVDDEAARAIVREHATGPITAAVADELIRTAGGSPLALSELPMAMGEPGDSGAQGAELALRLPPGSGIERAFRHRFEGLDEDVRRALTVVAAFESGPAATLLATLEQLGLGLQELEAGESAGLLKLEGGEVAFRHPLLRSLAYHAATSGARLAAHRAIAEIVTDPSLRAWHLSSAALGPDEEAAEALDEASRIARERGTLAAAAAATARAADLSTDDAKRAERLVSAATDLVELGRADEALARIDEAERYPEALAHGSDLKVLRGRVEMRSGALHSGRALIVAEAEHCAQEDPCRSAELLIEVGVVDMISGDSQAQIEAGQRAEELAKLAKDDHLVMFGQLARACGLVPLGRSKEADALFECAMPVMLESDPLPAASEMITFAAMQLAWIERFDLAEQIVNRQIEAAREASALGRLPFPLSTRAMIHDRRGRWAPALADAGEALRLARETAQPPQIAVALTLLASLEAARGADTEAREHAEEALAIVAEMGVGGPLPIYAEVALGFTALAGERLDEAIEHLVRADQMRRDLDGGEPAFLQYYPDLIEAHLRSGRKDAALRYIEQCEAEAEATGRTWAHAVAARGRGLMADDDEGYAEHFERAIAWHEKSDQPFPLARTRLAYGERLRRAGERTAAREQLTQAADAFERVGADPWVERANAELRASGQTLRARSMPDSDQLTPSELQVALRVAEGLTNREVAAAIFLSPKTVEHHLSSIYRKLGIRSRTELARRMASEPADAVPA